MVEFGGIQGCPKTRFLAFLLGFTTSLGLENPSTRDTVHGHNWIQYNHQIQIHLKSSIFTWCSPTNPSKMHINPTFCFTWQSSTYHHLKLCRGAAKLDLTLAACSTAVSACAQGPAVNQPESHVGFLRDEWFLLSDKWRFSMDKFHMFSPGRKWRWAMRLFEVGIFRRTASRWFREMKMEISFFNVSFAFTFHIMYHFWELNVSFA